MISPFFFISVRWVYVEHDVADVLCTYGFIFGVFPCRVTSIMKVNNLSDMPCPMARALGCVGEWWSLLIIRDAIQGFSRFDELQKSLGISTSMLARRLSQLVEQGLLEKHPYQQRPVRYEYQLTEKGRALYPIIIMLFNWGERYASPDGTRQITMVDRSDHQPIEPMVVDRRTMKPLTFDNTFAVPGPDVSPLMQARIDHIQAYWQAHYPLSESALPQEE